MEAEGGGPSSRSSSHVLSSGTHVFTRCPLHPGPARFEEHGGGSTLPSQLLLCWPYPHETKGHSPGVLSHSHLF